MTKQELSCFRKLLEANVVELDHSARHREDIRIEDSADELDRMVAAAHREVAVRSLQVASNKDRATRAALQRLDEGTFGICLECDQAISPRRLAAVPWASLCIHCQQARDGKMPMAA